DEEGRMVGVVTRTDVHQADTHPEIRSRPLDEIAHTRPIVAWPDEQLRVVVYRMAEAGVTRLPVVARDDPRQLLGLISLADLLQARRRTFHEERRRERVLRVHPLLPARRRRPASLPP